MAADLYFCSRSSSSSERCSSCCMEASALVCWTRIWRCLGGMGKPEYSARAMDLVRTTNASMVAFDLALGTGAMAAPDATLRLLGHAEPSPDARALFARCGAARGPPGPAARRAGAVRALRPDLADLRRRPRGHRRPRRAARLVGA